MIKIKKRICLEPFINREYPANRANINTTANVDEKGCPIIPLDVEVAGALNDNPKYGIVDKSFIHFPVFFRQSYDDMGLFSNVDFVESDVLINEALDPYTRKTALPVQNYYSNDEYMVTGLTESSLDNVRSYNMATPFIVGFNLHPTPSQGFTGVLEIKSKSIVYVIGGDVTNIGAYKINTGILMETFVDLRAVTVPITGEIKEIPYTTFSYIAKGYRDYNTSLKALIHEDKYLGVVFPPRIDNDILIDRGNINVFERHLKMSEIDTVEQLERYGQKFFRVQVV